MCMTNFAVAFNFDNWLISKTAIKAIQTLQVFIRKLVITSVIIIINWISPVDFFVLLIISNCEIKMSLAKSLKNNAGFLSACGK